MHREMEKDTDSGSNETSEANSMSLEESKPKKKGINLLKMSKHSLVRLLSVLEGEVEARDIYISTLQAQLNNQKNARQNYFVHRMNDPFLALHRDDYVSGNPLGEFASYGNEMRHTEPLPLLEKVVSKFKTQQQKMHQQMALASKIHRKMAHELAEEKRKHAFDTKTGDDVTMALEKERERLKASVMCEKERTKRIEIEYKKLLLLCKEDGRKHRMIVMALLSEQERLLQQLKQSRELQINNDSTETELQANLHEALKQKQDLALKLKEEQRKYSVLEKKVLSLEQQATQLNYVKLAQSQGVSKTALEEAVSIYACDDHEDENETEENVATPELPVKMSRASSSSTSSSTVEKSEKTMAVADPVSAFMNKQHPMRVAQSTQDVTLIPTSSHPPILLADGVGVTTSGYYSVKPGSSIAGLEAIKSAATNKEMLSLDLSKDEVFLSNKNGTSPEPSPPDVFPKPTSNNIPPKPTRFIPGSTFNSPFRTSHSPLSSSPTSGAANFAMNSPNSPNPPLSSPFSITRSPTVKANPKFKGGATTKLSSYVTKSSSPGRSSGRPGQNSQFQSTRMKFQMAQVGQNSQNLKGETPKPKEDFVSERKIQAKKFTSVTYRSHITQKVSAPTTLPNVSKLVNSSKSELSSSNESEKVKQPLPPKTRPSTAPATNTAQVRPPPLPPKKPSLSSEKPSKRPSSTSDVGKPLNSVPRKSGSTKRTVPLTSSNENTESASAHRVNKSVKGPAPPSLPAKMSSQQPSPPAGPRQPPQQR